MIDELRKAVSDTYKRFHRNIEGAITNAALGTVTETDELAAYLDHAVAVFNSHADEIDGKFGEGWFGVRLVRDNAYKYHIEGNRWLASVKLDYLTATDPRPVYKWMNDLLLMDSLPEKTIRKQASVREGFWNRILRKRKWAIAAWNAKKAQEHREATAQRIAEAEKRDFRRHIDELSNAVGGIVPAGWPRSWKHGLPAPSIRGRGRRVAAKPSMKAQDETNAHMTPGDQMRFNRADAVRFKADMKKEDDHTDLRQFKADDIKDHNKMDNIKNLEAAIGGLYISLIYALKPAQAESALDLLGELISDSRTGHYERQLYADLLESIAMATAPQPLDLDELAGALQ